MPLIRQKLILRVDLKSNPKVLYIFGDNAERRGLGGQAREMRGEPNAVGVRTKLTPHLAFNSFMSDDNYDYNRKMINEDFVRLVDHARVDGIIVIPYDGIGTGLVQMSTHCPQTFAYLQARISALENE